MQKWSWMLIGSSFQNNNQQQQQAFTLASLTIVAIVFVINQRYDYTSCFGFLSSRRDEDNINNNRNSNNNNNNEPTDSNDDDKIDDRKGKIEDDEENKATTCIDDDDKSPNPKIIPFPWEPKATNIITTTITNERTKPTIASFPPAAYTTSSRSSSSTNHHKKEKEELNFLATMSFANGGMRSPNCPCCY